MTASQIDEATAGTTLDGATMSLTGEERAALQVLARRLSERPPGLVDDHRWLAAARDQSAELPLSIRQRLRRFVRDPGPDALLLLRRLPVEVEALPPTPTRAESVERHSTPMASALALIALQLGEPVAFRDEKSGALIQNVVPVAGMESFQGNAGSTMLTAHVENAFHVYRPDFVGLLCLRNDHANVAGLQVASIRRALPLLSRRTRQVLAEPRFRTGAPASFGAVDASSPHPVLTGDRADPDLKVDFVSTRALDDVADAALRHLADTLNDVRRTIVLMPGDLAFVDNRLAAHGRTAFRARYDGRDRWLQRVFVHRDLRRSRPARPGDGYVLSSAPGHQSEGE